MYSFHNIFPIGFLNSIHGKEEIPLGKGKSSHNQPAEAYRLIGDIGL
jgi:hypothetical protein